ncbi:magnesium transporter [bacterium]|nr:magnesium transporter [bacterium]
MDESFISVKPNDDIESIIDLFKEYHFENIPVVNNENRLIGIISDNDILPAIEEEVTEDIYNMYGIQKTEETYFKSSIIKIVKSRLLWVVVLMVSATLTSVAISLFQNLGASITAGVSTALLVPIIPVITGTSGNTGSQSFATTVRLIAIGDVTPKEYKKLIFNEFKIGLLLGFFVSIINFARLLIYFAIPAFRQNEMDSTTIPYVETIFISLCASFAL